VNESNANMSYARVLRFLGLEKSRQKFKPHLYVKTITRVSFGSLLIFGKFEEKLQQIYQLLLIKSV